MNKVRIVIDSTTDVSTSVRDRLTVIPLNIMFGKDQYIDGVTIDHRRFYELLTTSDVLPTTSQPTPEAFANVYRQARAQGEDVVVLTISSSLSGTYQCATLAAEDYPEHVFVVDSRNVTIGAGVLAELALQLVDAGMSAAAIAQRLIQERDNVRMIALLDTLEYLQRGGRISKVAAMAGSLLSIKPVIEVRKGELNLLGKARGARQGYNLLTREVESTGGIDFARPVLLGYTGLDDQLLRNYVASSADLWQPGAAEIPVAAVGSVVGTHGGPGAIATAFFVRP